MLRRHHRQYVFGSSSSLSIYLLQSTPTTAIRFCSQQQQQNQNISSFLQRLLESSRDFSISMNPNHHSNGNNSEQTFNNLMHRSNSIEDIFSHTDVRFHSIRVPVQREKAKLRALKRKSQVGQRKSNAKLSSNISKEDDNNGENQNEEPAEEEQEQDPTKTVKSLTNDQSKEVNRRLKRLPRLANNKNSAPSSSSSNHHHQQFKLPVKIICSAAKDMREDRFCVYLKTITEKIRSRYGALPADNFAGLLCRFWLNSQKNAGLSFPSSESAYSPLLPTMLFFSAARDPELFKELVAKIDRERGRFTGNNNNSNSNNRGATDDASGENNSTSSLLRYGSSSFTSSTMVGWIAAMSVTMETAIPVLRKRLLDLQQESKNKSNNNNKKKNSSRLDDDDDDDVVDHVDIAKITTNNSSETITIVELASQKLKSLLTDERCFTVASPVDAVKTVLPVILSTLLNPLAHSPPGSSTSFYQLRQNIPPISVVSFVPGTRQSASTFELWNKFMKRFYLSSPSSPTTATSTSSSANHHHQKKKIANSFLHSPIPPYLVSFLLQACQQEADSLLSHTKPTRLSTIPGRVTPTTAAALMTSRNNFGALPLIFNNTYSTNITASMDEIESLAIGTFCRVMRDCYSSFNNTLRGGEKIPFVLYSRLLRALSSCGCSSWVMETIVKDCLAVLHGHTSMNLCHVVASSLHHQKVREALLMVCNNGNHSNNNTNIISCEDDFYSKWTNHTSSSSSSLLLKTSQKQQQLIHKSNNNNFLLLPKIADKNHQQRHDEQNLFLPVDTVLCSISNDMWNTLVDACVLLVTKKQEDGEAESSSSSMMNSSTTLPPALLNQLAFTRIRSACLELVKNPSKIFDLLNALISNNSNNFKSASSFETFLLEKVGDGDEVNFWCDPVVVISTWLLNKNTHDENENLSHHSQCLRCLLGALADVSVELRNIFDSSTSFSASSTKRKEYATAAARILDFLISNNINNNDNKEKSSSILFSQSSSKSTQETSSSSSFDEEAMIPLYWDTVCTIAVSTNDIHWLHDQYLFLMMLTNSSRNNNINSPSSSSSNVPVVYGAKLLSRFLTPSILKKTCHVIAENFGTRRDIRFFRNNNNTNNSEDGKMQEKDSFSSSSSSPENIDNRCVALNRLLERICKYTSQYSLELFTEHKERKKKNTSSSSSSFIISLIDTDPDVDFCLRPRQRGEHMDNTRVFDDNSFSVTTTTPTLQFYHQDRKHSKKSVLELNSTVANPSLGGAQLGVLVEAGRGLIPQSFAVAACAVPSISSIHPSTSNALQVALQSAHETAPFGIASDVAFAKKLSWRTSGFGQMRKMNDGTTGIKNNNNTSRDESSSNDDHVEENDGEGIDHEELMAKRARDCITDIIEGYAN